MKKCSAEEMLERYGCQASGAISVGGGGKLRRDWAVIKKLKKPCNCMGFLSWIDSFGLVLNYSPFWGENCAFFYVICSVDDFASALVFIAICIFIVNTYIPILG